MIRSFLKQLALVFVIWFSCGRLWAAGPYYVDPLYTGGGSNGTSTNPWILLSDGWATISTGLASGPVTVYFSACNPACTAPETSSSQMDLTLRTDASTNILTLDGGSKYNTNSATPSWTTNQTPAACTGWRCAATASWMKGQKFKVTGNTPITGPTAANNCIGYFTIQGFEFANSGGQGANLSYIHDLIFQYNEVHRTGVGDSVGPGVIIGPAGHGPCHTGAARPAGTDNGPDNVTLQYNYLHDPWGEQIYAGASAPDPFVANSGCTQCQQFEAGVSGDNLQCGNGCNSNSTVCAVPGTAASCHTGDNYLIQNNTIESAGSWGGQGDGIDVKDGHTNLRVIGNTIRTGLPTTQCPAANQVAGVCPSYDASHLGAGFPGDDGQGILFESGTQVIGNYIEHPGHQCIPVYSSWHNSIGRGDMLIANNFCINATSGVGSNVAYHVYDPNVAGEAIWSTVEIYNNAIYNTSDIGIKAEAGSTTGAVTAKNNILHTTVGSLVGTITHDYNDYFNTGNCLSETNGICTDPTFVSTATPYLDTNFKLQGTSPDIRTGLNLGSVFTTDYFNVTHPGTWDIGPVQFYSTGFGLNLGIGLNVSWK